MARKPYKLQPPNPGRSLLSVMVFMIGFAVVLVTVCWVYLFPALRAAGSAVKDNDHQGTRELAATAWLILVVVLFVIFAGLTLAFRIGRFFFPRPRLPGHQPTRYSDAWAESGRRMNPPGEPGDEET